MKLKERPGTACGVDVVFPSISWSIAVRVESRRQFFDIILRQSIKGLECYISGILE